MADFGHATQLEGENGKLYTKLGTEHYMAPEIHLGKPYDGCSVDVFSCGVILFMMVSGHSPFYQKADPKADPLYKCIVQGKHDVFWNTHESYMIEKSGFNQKRFFSIELRDLISKMLAFEPNERPNIEEIKEHPWFREDFYFSVEMKEELRNELEKTKVRIAEEVQKEREMRKKFKLLLRERNFMTGAYSGFKPY